MLQAYLGKESCDRLVNSLKDRHNRPNPTIYIFIGSGNNGKTTVANHLVSMLPNVGYASETFEHLDLAAKKYRHVIFETNIRKDIEKVEMKYKPLGYTIEVYEFPNLLT